MGDKFAKPRLEDVVSKLKAEILSVLQATRNTAHCVVLPSGWNVEQLASHPQMREVEGEGVSRVVSCAPAKHILRDRMEVGASYQVTKGGPSLEPAATEQRASWTWRRVLSFGPVLRKSERASSGGLAR